MGFLDIFKGKSPAQKARETRVRRYGQKGTSPRGLERISRTHRKPETKLSIEGNRLVLKHKPMKTAKHEYRASVDHKIDLEGSRRQYHRKGLFTEGGISSQKGLFARMGKKRGSNVTLYGIKRPNPRGR